MQLSKLGTEIFGVHLNKLERNDAQVLWAQAAQHLESILWLSQPRKQLSQDWSCEIKCHRITSEVGLLTDAGVPFQRWTLFFSLVPSHKYTNFFRS